MCFESMATVAFHFYYQRGPGTSVFLFRVFFLKCPPWQWRGVALANKKAYYCCTKNTSLPAHTLHPASSTPSRPRLSDLWVRLQPRTTKQRILGAGSDDVAQSMLGPGGLGSGRDFFLLTWLPSTGRCQRF